MTSNSTLPLHQHPVIRHKISTLRDKTTPPKQFRDIVRELSMFTFVEASQHLTLTEYSLETPHKGKATGYRVKERIALVPILRSGLGMLDGISELVPEAQIYHLGIYRDQRTKQPVEYYTRLPAEVTVDVCYVLDPMLATGGTSAAAASILKDWGATRDSGPPRICILSLFAVHEALEMLASQHPDVRHVHAAARHALTRAASVTVCQIDEGLDEGQNQPQRP